MRLLTVAVFLAVAALVSAQFDREAFDDGLDLSLSSSDIPGRFEDSVDDYVIACDVKVHDVNNVDSFDKFTRGGYTVAINATESLYFSLVATRNNGSQFTLCDHDLTRGPNNAGNPVGCTYSCPGNQRCFVDYYCSPYEEVEDLQVEVYQPSTVEESVIYTLQVIQWVEDVEVISLDNDGFYEVDTKDPRFVDVFGSDETIPTSHYHHYFLDLERQLTNRGYHSSLTITLGNFVDVDGLNATSGDVTFCYNVDNIVAGEGSLPSDGDCNIECDDVSLNNNDGTIEITYEFLGCEVPQDELYFGVQTPDYVLDYTFEVVFDEARNYPIEVQTEQFYATDAFLDNHDDAECDPSNGRFTCERYYETNLDNFGGSFQKTALGPFFFSRIHGVNSGSVAIVINDDKFGGPKSRCDATKQYVCGNDFNGIGNSDPNNGLSNSPYTNSSFVGASEQTGCLVVIPTCAWNDDLSNNWVSTVFSTVDHDTSDQIFYGLDMDIVYFDQINVVPRVGVFLVDIGELKRGYYQHYQVIIQSNVITPGARLIAEMSSKDESSAMTFFWNWESNAGYNEHCYDYQGACTTRQDDFYDNINTGFYPKLHSDRCRFSWFVCDEYTASVLDDRNEESVYEESIQQSLGFQNTTNAGISVSNLAEGTLYLSAHAQIKPVDLADGEGSSYYELNYDDVSEYTVELSWEVEEELEFGEIVFAHTYHDEYSRQFFIDMPDDEDVTGISLSIADVSNNGALFSEDEQVIVYWECDAFAGACPCYTSTEFYKFTNWENDTQTTFNIARNACPGRVYASVYFSHKNTGFDYGIYAPVGFTVLALPEYALAGLPINQETGIATPFVVPRAPEWGTVIGFAPAFNEETCTACSTYDFYVFEYSTNLVESDGLQVRLEIVPSVDNAVVHGILYVFSESEVVGRQFGSCNRGAYLQELQLQSCSAVANEELHQYYYEQVYSYCTIHLEACSAVTEYYNFDDSDACNEFEFNTDSGNTLLRNDREFYINKKYYAAVQNIESNSGFTYNLQAAVYGQSVETLSDGVTIVRTNLDRSYRHYSIAAESGNAASLYVDVWAIYEEFPEVIVFLNAGSPAGAITDCFADITTDLGLCGNCLLAVAPNEEYINPSCRYQIPACELIPTETYFVSVYTPIQQYTTYHSDHQFGYEFSIRAYTQIAEELLENNGHPVTGHLKPYHQFSPASSYYTVQVPSDAFTNPTRVNILVSSVSQAGDGIYVWISETDPSVFCSDCEIRRELYSYPRDTPGKQHNNIEWSRDACSLDGGELFYITVSTNSLARRNDIPTFSLHAWTQEYFVEELRLISDSDEPLRNATALSEWYDSYEQVNPAASPVGPFTIRWGEYRAYSFAPPSGVVGMNIRVIQEDTANPGPYTVYVTNIIPRGGVSQNDDTDEIDAEVGDLPFDCDSFVPIISSDIVDNNNEFFRHYGPCAINFETYYITLSGDDLEVNDLAEENYITVTFFDAIDVDIDIPGSNETVTFVFDDENLIRDSGEDEVWWNDDHTHFVVNGLSLDAGEVMVVDLDFSSGSVHWNFDSPAGDGCSDVCSNSQCTFYACDNMNFDLWFHTDDPNAIAELTISITSDEVGNRAIDNIDIINPGNPLGNYTGFGSNHWRWHSVTVPSKANGQVYFDYSNNLSPGSDFWRASSPVMFPGDFAGSNEYYIDNVFGTITADESCGGSDWNPTSMDNICCFGEEEYIFAVIGSQNDYSLALVELDFDTGVSSGSGSGTVGFDETNSSDGLDGIEWLEFTIDEDTIGFYYQLINTSDEDEALEFGSGLNLFVNYGSLAGSNNDDVCPNPSDSPSNPAGCYFNNNNDFLPNACSTVQQGDTSCSAYVNLCDTCLEAGSVIYFGIQANDLGEVPYDFEFIQISESGNFEYGLVSDSINIEWPPSALDDTGLFNVWTGSFNGDSIYSHYSIDVSMSPADLDVYFPFIDSDNDIKDGWAFQFHIEMTDFTTGGDFLDDLDEVRTLISTSACNLGSQLSSSFCDIDFDEDSDDSLGENYRICVTSLSFFYDGGNCDFTETLYLSVSSNNDRNDTISFDLNTFYTVNETAIEEYFGLVSVSSSSASNEPVVPSSFTEFDSVTIDNGDQNSQWYIEIDTTNFGVNDWVTIYLSFEDNENGMNGRDINLSSGDILIYNYIGDTWNQVASSTDLYTDCLAAEFSNSADGTTDEVVTCRMDFSPGEFGNFFDIDDSLPIYLYLNFDDDSIEYSFGVNVAVRSANVVDGIHVFDTAEDNEFTFDKQIHDYEWHFYTFEIEENTGHFDYLSFDVVQTDCTDGSLEVFYSVAGNEDYAHPEFLPTDSCHVIISGNPSTSVDGNCYIDGGLYFVGIWAPSDAQSFQDPIRIPLNNNNNETTIRPATYELTALLEVVPQSQVLDPECRWESLNVVDMNRRFMIPVEAENRGGELTVTLSFSEDSTAPVTLYVSKNGFPYTSGCPHDDTATSGDLTNTIYDYACEIGNGDNSCTVTVPECEFRSGRYFVYFDSVSTAISDDATVYLRSQLHSVYIPVIDFAVSGAAWEVVSSDIGNYRMQYYKVVGDWSSTSSTLIVDVDQYGCHDDCDLSVVYIGGPAGFASFASNGDSDSNAASNEYTCGLTQRVPDDDCNCYTGTDISLGAICPTPDAVGGHDEYFFGVYNDRSGLCSYRMYVRTDVADLVEPLIDGVPICEVADCIDIYWVEFDVSEGLLLSEVSIELESDSDHDIEYSFDRIPSFTCANNVTSSGPDVSHSLIENIPCGADGMWIAVKRSNTDATCVLNDDLFDLEESLEDGAEYSNSVSACAAEFSPTVSYRLSVATVPIDLVVSEISFDDAFASSRTVYRGLNSNCPFNFCDSEVFPDDVYYASVNTTLLSSNVTDNIIQLDDSRTEVTLTGDEPVARFSIEIAPNTERYTVYVDNVDASCSSSGGEEFYFGVSANGLADSYCLQSCSSIAESIGAITYDVNSNNCGSQVLHTDLIGCEDEVIYIDLTNNNGCYGESACDTTFSIWVVLEEFDGEFIGTAHDDSNAWTTVRHALNNPDTCFSDSGSADVYLVDVQEGFLNVQIRNPVGAEGHGSLSVTATTSDARSCGVSDGSCSINLDVDRHDYSCQTNQGFVSPWACVPNGLYKVSVSGSGFDTNANAWGYSISAYNQYVPLTGSVSTSIIGQQKYFYSVSTGGQALRLTLNVLVGPSITLRVFEGCEKDSITDSFSSMEHCGYGGCWVDLSTRALHPGSDNVYIVLESGGLSSSYHENVFSEKDTEFTLSVAVGTAACASRSSVVGDFCGSSATDIDSAFTESPFVSGSPTWDYRNGVARDNMAYWRYSDFVNDACPTPTDNCKRWIRTLTCLESFPECDASGFLTGVCQGVCQQVQCECGAWLSENYYGIEIYDYVCGNARYQDGETGSCVPLPTPEPVPTPEPLPVIIVNLEDDCVLHIATVDEQFITPVEGVSSSCSPAEIEDLLLSQSGSLTVEGQLATGEISGNDISVQVFGSNVETATSLCTRLTTIVNYIRPAALTGTCLENAIVQIEEPNSIVHLIPTASMPLPPTSVINPPVIDFPTITIPGITIPDFTIPSFTIPGNEPSTPTIDIGVDETVSGASVAVPAFFLLAVAVLLALF